MRNVNGTLGLAVLTVAIATLTCGSSTAGEKKSKPKTSQQAKTAPNPRIDYRGFLRLAIRLEAVREKHRVPIDDFMKMAKEEGTIILDTRSKKAFDDIHITGAIHLNFSDFTEEKLAEVIPNKNTRILIYCNNNFKTQKVKAFRDKRAPLALNVPTFVNLHGYGYENVYELADALELDEPGLKLTARPKVRTQFAKR